MSGQENPQSSLKDHRILLDRLSHEMITPIYAIRFQVEFLLRHYNDLKDDIKVRKLNALLGECDLLLLLTESLSISSNIEKRIELRKRKTNFYYEVLEPAIRALKQKADLKRVSILHDEIHHSPELFVDPERAKHIFINVILNAIEYSFEGTRIDVFYEKSLKGYIICVRNYGIGVPMGEDKAIFKSGVRGSNASAMCASGPGLGLSVCKRLIRAHGGKIWFERGKTAKEGNEITFKLLFPFAFEEQE